MPISIGIVDDSPAIRKVLRDVFKTKTNWQICGEAENGEAAAELVRQVHPDLLVLDLSMPVMNGLDAARKIKVVSPRTGIVLYTGHASDQLEVEAKAIGIRAVLAKDGPASLERLLATLDEASQREFSGVGSGGQMDNMTLKTAIGKLALAGEQADSASSK